MTRFASAQIGPTSAQCLGVIACLVGFAAAAPRHEAEKKLTEVEHARAGTLAVQTVSSRQAAEAATREAVLARERTQAASRLRFVETRVQDAIRQVERAAAAQKQAEGEVARRSDALAAMLPLALRLSLHPVETLLAAPVPPQSAVEGLLAAHGVSAELVREVAALRAEQDNSRALAISLVRRQSALRTEQARQTLATAELDREIAQANRVQARAVDEAAIAAQEAAGLAAQAQDLRSAIAAMDVVERRRADAAARAAGGQGHLPMSGPRIAWAGPGLGPATPRVTLVAGRLTRQWGAPSEDGPATGITYSAVPGASVNSPCTGRVIFAAPFRSYGHLMIIACGRFYDFVLAGMDELEAALGRDVRAGEPVGRMPKGATAAGRTPLLYAELRRNGAPIDPMPYLNGKP